MARIIESYYADPREVFLFFYFPSDEYISYLMTVENQKRADERLSVFSQIPIKHKNIICQPMIAAIDLEQYLAGVELAVAGG